MAQINEYLPEVDATQPMGSTSPNIELSGAVGKSIQNLGSSITQAGQEVFEAKSKAETADVYSAMADARLNYTTRVQQQVQDGSLDIDQLKQDFDDETGKIGDNLSTPQGKNYFQRQQSRLKGAILHQAVTGSAQIASNEAKGKWTDGVNKNSSTLFNDPGQFEDLYNHGLETVDALIADEHLPEKDRSKAVQQMSSQFAMAAVQGWANMKPEWGKTMLQDGGLGDYLTVQQKDEANRYINTQANAKDIESERADRAVQRARKATAEKFGQDNFPAIHDGTYPPQNIVNAVKNRVLTEEQGQHYLAAIKASNKEKLESDPQTYLDALKRINDPSAENPITSPEQIMSLVGQEKIAMKGSYSADTLMDALKKSPEGGAVSRGEAALQKSVTEATQFEDMMGHGKDPRGTVMAAAAMSDYYQKKRQYTANGGKASDLLDPRNPNYFNPDDPKYKYSQEEQMGLQAEGRINKALNLPQVAGEKPKVAGPPPTSSMAAFAARSAAKRAGIKLPEETPPMPEAAPQLPAAVGTPASISAPEPSAPAPQAAAAKPAPAPAAPASRKGDDVGALSDDLGLSGKNAEEREQDQAMIKKLNKMDENQLKKALGKMTKAQRDRLGF